MAKPNACSIVVRPANFCACANGEVKSTLISLSDNVSLSSSGIGGNIFASDRIAYVRSMTLFRNSYCNLSTTGPSCCNFSCVRSMTSRAVI